MLTFSMTGIVLGEVHIMSSPLLIQHKFVQALGEFCFDEPQEFFVSEPKVKINNYYFLAFQILILAINFV